MISFFDQMASRAHNALEAVFGTTVSIDGVSGVAVITPQDDMMLGGGVEMVGGAHLLFRAAEFPDIEVRSEVTADKVEYVVIELDDTDSAGVRHARMAPA